MISKKMMIIGGSIAGAAVVTTAVVVPVVLTSSHGGSSTPSIDEDKLPKISLSNKTITSRNLGFTAKLEHNDENYVVEKVKFYIKEKSNQEITVISSDEINVENGKDIDFKTSEDGSEMERNLKSDTEYVVYSSYVLEDETKTKETLIKDNVFKTLPSIKPNVKNIKEEVSINSFELSFDVDSDDHFYDVEEAYITIRKKDTGEILENANNKKLEKTSTGFKYHSGNDLAFEESMDYNYQIYYDDYGNDYNESSLGELFIGTFTTSKLPQAKINIVSSGSNTRDAWAEIEIVQPGNIYDIDWIAIYLIDNEGNEVQYGKQIITKNIGANKIKFSTIPNAGDNLFRRLNAGSSYTLRADYIINDVIPEDEDKSERTNKYYSKDLITINTKSENKPTLTKEPTIDTSYNSAEFKFSLEQPINNRKIRSNNRSDNFYDAKKVRIELFNMAGNSIDYKEFDESEFSNMNYIFGNLLPATEYRYEITYDDIGDDYDGCEGKLENGSGNLTTENEPEGITKPSFSDTGFKEIPYYEFSNEGFTEHNKYDKNNGRFTWGGGYDYKPGAENFDKNDYIYDYDFTFDAKGIDLASRRNFDENDLTEFNGNYNNMNLEFIDKDDEISDFDVFRFNTTNMSNKFYKINKEEYHPIYNVNHMDITLINELIYQSIDEIIIKNKENEELKVKLNKGYEFDYYDENSLNEFQKHLEFWTHEDAYELEVLENSSFNGFSFKKEQLISIVNYEYFLSGDFGISAVPDGLVNYKKNDIYIKDGDKTIYSRNNILSKRGLMGGPPSNGDNELLPIPNWDWDFNIDDIKQENPEKYDEGIAKLKEFEKENNGGNFINDVYNWSYENSSPLPKEEFWKNWILQDYGKWK